MNTNTLEAIAGTYSFGGGGAGGAGDIIEACNSILVAGIHNVTGGCAGSGLMGNGGAGGAGRFASYIYTTPPITVAVPMTYPIQLYTQSTDPTAVFTLNQLYGGISTTLQSGVANILYVPPANQPSGLYIYNIVETNALGSQVLLLNISMNMTDIASAFTFNNPIIQYYPNEAFCPTWPNPPLSWTIQGDAGSSYTFANAIINGQCGDEWMNANTYFTPTVTLTYNGFAPFTANSINNPKIAGITQSPALLLSANPAYPAAFNTLPLFSLSTWQQSTLTTVVNALGSASFNWQIGPYTGYAQQSFYTLNSNTVYTANSAFSNPPICMTNLVLSATASGYSPIYNYLTPVCQYYGNAIKAYSDYLANSLYAVEYDVAVENATSATFIPSLVVESGYNPATGVSTPLTQFYTPSGSGTYIYLQNTTFYTFSAYTPSAPYKLLATSSYVQATSCPSGYCTEIIKIGNFTIPLAVTFLSGLNYNCTTSTIATNTMQVGCTFSSKNGTSYNWQLQTYNTISSIIPPAMTCNVAVNTASGYLSCTGSNTGNT
jgi:hypothetical protein